jgi:hypothetical protein
MVVNVVMYFDVATLGTFDCEPLDNFLLYATEDLLSLKLIKKKKIYCL